jgi:signal transduction histidine kinase
LTAPGSSRTVFESCMRPFLLYVPGGVVPEGIRKSLADAGAEILIAATPEEALVLLERETPDLLLVVPPGRIADAAPLLTRLEELSSPPPVFVLAADGEVARPVALEVVPQKAWERATSSLGGGALEPASAILLTRVQLVTLLELWEELRGRSDDFEERTLRLLARSLDASRVSLFRWKAGEPLADVAASSLGAAVIGRQVEIVRYPELRAAAGRSGPVLVEEIDRDPLMEDASRFLSGVPIRSLLCQRLPGEGSALYLHAVRERVPFGLSDVALTGAAARLLQAARGSARTSDSGEKPEKRRLRTIDLLFRGIPEPTALISPTGEMLLVNPPFRELTGRLETELVGLDYRTLLRPAQPEDAFGDLSRTDGSRVEVARARLLTASGESVPVDVLSLPTSDETFGAAGWSSLTLRDRREEHGRKARELGLERDLEDASGQLEELQRATREADSARARFWTAAAHELRTPLAIVQSHLEVVLSDLSEGIPEKPLGLLKAAGESLQRLERLIADVLDAAVAGRARATLKVEPVDLKEIVTGLWEDLSGMAARRGLRLKLDLPTSLPHVSGDREKIARLLTSLIDHSLRSTPRAEEVVTISGRVESGRVVVSIVDRGPALSPEKASHLFDDLGAGRGAGDLGLSVARRLAEAMDAELRAAPRDDGANVKSVAWPLAR